MTREEAIQIAHVLRSVDGGCCVCVEGACEEMTVRIPEWVWMRCHVDDHYGCVIVAKPHTDDTGEHVHD